MMLQDISSSSSKQQEEEEEEEEDCELDELQERSSSASQSSSSEVSSLPDDETTVKSSSSSSSSSSPSSSKRPPKAEASTFDVYFGDYHHPGTVAFVEACRTVATRYDDEYQYVYPETYGEIEDSIINNSTKNPVKKERMYYVFSQVSSEWVPADQNTKQEHFEKEFERQQLKVATITDLEALVAGDYNNPHAQFTRGTGGTNDSKQRPFKSRLVIGIIMCLILVGIIVVVVVGTKSRPNSDIENESARATNTPTSMPTTEKPTTNTPASQQESVIITSSNCTERCRNVTGIPVNANGEFLQKKILAYLRDPLLSEYGPNIGCWDVSQVRDFSLLILCNFNNMIV
jgi:hypothetical protein